MVENSKATDNNFMQYLSEKVPPSKFSELCSYYSDIEAFCRKIGILKKPLFETTDFETIKKVRRTIEQNKIFRVTRKKHHAKIIAACHYYYVYVRERKLEITDTLDISNENVRSIAQPDDTLNTDSISADSYTDKKIVFSNASTSLPSVSTLSLEKKVQDALQIDTKPAEKTTEQNVDESLYVNFGAANDLAYTKPEYFSYFGGQKICANTWTDLYVDLFAVIYEDYVHLLNLGMSFSNKKARIELATNEDYNFMIAPKPVPGTNLMLETNVSANDVVAKIKFILDLCNVDYENVVISYRKREAVAKSKEQNAAVLMNRASIATQTMANDDTATRKQLKENERTILHDMEQILLRADMDGMSYDDLKEALHITMLLTKRLVAQSTKIVDVKGILIHEEAFIDWEDGADALEIIIEKLMQKNNGYISGTQLFEYARTEMNMFLNDNDMCEERAVYDIAQHLFEKEHYHEKSYAFRGKMHISRVDTEIGSNLDVYKKYAADQGGVFSLNGLADYLESIGVGTGNLRNQMRMWAEPIFFFYDYNVIATAEALCVDEDWKKAVKKSLDILFEDAGDHMILRNIPPIWFERLPTISGNRPWTPLLLQSVLRFYGKELGARTIQALDGQSLETLHAMLVESNSPIQNFGDVVISYLIEQNIGCRKFEAEELRLLLAGGGILHGNELIWNMPKALKQDERFAWDASGNQVTIKI